MSAVTSFDVTVATFETEVVARSRTVPVLLDFWADWCGPCRTLRPVLDKLVEEFGGAFLLGAVNTEVEQDLAYAFQVQSIPFCVLLVGGRPVDAFQGALPEADVRKFLARAGIKPIAREEAAPADPEQAKLAAARRALASGEWQAARDALAGIPEEHEAAAVAARITAGLEIFSATIDPAEAAAAAAAARGRDLFLGKQPAAAVDAWIDSVAADRAWRAGLARRAVVMAFELLGADEAGRERVRASRARLANLLY